MTKAEVLTLIKKCKIIAEKTLKREDLTIAQEKELSQIVPLLDKYETHIKTNVKETDTELLKQYATQFTAMYENLKKISTPVSIITRHEGSLCKEKEVIPKKKQKEETKKERKKAWDIIRNILAILGILAILSTMIFALRSCDINQDYEEEQRPGFEHILERSINDIDINNYEQLMGYAEEIQRVLGEDSELSIEEIMYIIRLGNFDRLRDKDVFKDRDEIYTATAGIGEITNVLGSDSIIIKDERTDIYVSDMELKDIIMCVTDNALSIDCFAAAKTRNGYDIYRLVDICVQGINAGNEYDVLYAKVFNDILARKIAAFTITPDSPISTYYTLLGMYNANSKRILELTSGIGLTSVYGDETRIDGYYGFICVEELEAYLQVGNENNIFYTTIIDENITNHSQHRQGR